MAFAWPFSSTVAPFSVFLVVSVPGIDYSWNFQKFRLKETPEQPLAIQEPEKSARIIANVMRMSFLRRLQLRLKCRRKDAVKIAIAPRDQANGQILLRGDRPCRFRAERI